MKTRLWQLAVLLQLGHVACLERCESTTQTPVPTTRKSTDDSKPPRPDIGTLISGQEERTVPVNDADRLCSSSHKLSIDAHPALQFAVGPAGAMFATTAKGLYRLSLDTKKWQLRSATKELPNLVVASQDVLLAGTQRQCGGDDSGTALMVSRDGGKSFASARHEDGPILAAPMATSHSRLFGLECSPGFSDDNGMTWSFPGSLSFDSSIADLAVDPHSGDLYLATLNDGPTMGIYKALKEHDQYTRPTLIRKVRGAASLAVDTRSTLYVGAMDGVWVGKNGGTSWSVYNSGLDKVLLRPASPRWGNSGDKRIYDFDVADSNGIVWAATKDGLYALVGDRWHRVNPEEAGEVYRVASFGDEVFFQAKEGTFCLNSDDVNKVRHMDATRAWSVRCSPEQCVIEVGDLVVNPGSRGNIECSPFGNWLACLYSHQSQLHLQRAWLIQLQAQRATELKLPTTGAPEQLVRVLGPPVWEGQRVRMTVVSGQEATRYEMSGVEQVYQYWELPAKP